MTAYQTNAVALARVQQLWGRDEFHNPFIIEESRASLWNIVELERVVTGNDTAAPTLANMLRAVAKHVRDDKFIARNGAKLTTPAEAQAHSEVLYVRVIFV